MAHIIYRKLHEKSRKSKWMSPNRKYKYLFWINVIGELGYATTQYINRYHPTFWKDSICLIGTLLKKL